MPEYDHKLIEYVRGLDASGLQHNFSISAVRPPPDAEYENAAFFNFFIAGRNTGYATLIADHEARYVQWIHFFPHSRKEGLERRGIGTLAHVAAIRALVERERPEPGFEVMHTSPTRNRLQHMSAMGLRTSEPLRDYMGKSISYANHRGFRFDNPFDWPR
ncbi:MAG: hypothetical protein J4400_05175 [Candidatus Aenigmarchaeota archaeon]|nr:hypothetical protein [Candidatus Aenigmarchaeota archaeon]